jgi:hypothetical protein
MTRRGVAAVLPPETDDEDEDVEEEPDLEDEVQAPAAEVDEGSVTADEEAVTDEAAREEVASDRN